MKKVKLKINYNTDIINYKKDTIFTKFEDLYKESKDWGMGLKSSFVESNPDIFEVIEEIPEYILILKEGGNNTDHPQRINFYEYKDVCSLLKVKEKLNQYEYGKGFIGKYCYLCTNDIVVREDYCRPATEAEIQAWKLGFRLQQAVWDSKTNEPLGVIIEFYIGYDNELRCRTSRINSYYKLVEVTCIIPKQILHKDEKGNNIYENDTIYYIYKDGRNNYKVETLNLVNCNHSGSAYIFKSNTDAIEFRKEKLLKKAKKDYPVGTRFISPVGGEFKVNDELRWSNNIYNGSRGIIYHNKDDKWAEIIKQERTYNYKGEQLTKEKILERCKKEYVIGTRFISSIVDHGRVRTVCKYSDSNGDPRLTIIGEYVYFINGIGDSNGCSNPYIYSFEKEEACEIIKDEPLFYTEDFKDGSFPNLFTTNDGGLYKRKGNPIYKGDECWLVCRTNTNVFNSFSDWTCISNPTFHTTYVKYKYFINEENARKYAKELENELKPKLKLGNVTVELNNSHVVAIGKGEVNFVQWISWYQYIQEENEEGVLIGNATLRLSNYETIIQFPLRNTNICKIGCIENVTWQQIEEITKEVKKLM